jgi:hypothetical protein
MKKAIVKLGFCVLFFCMAQVVYATQPDVSVTRIGGSPVASSSVQFTVAFSAPVTGFTSSDVTLTDNSGTPTAAATVGVAVAGASSYTVTVSGLTSGTFTVTIPAGAALEAAAPNDPNKSSTLSPGTPQATVDLTGPVATIDSTPDPTTGASSIDFTVSFSEPIDPTTLVAASVDLASSSGSISGFLTVGPITELAPMDHTNYKITINVGAGAPGGAGQHVVLKLLGTVKDPLGNSNTSVLTNNDVVYSGVVPTLGTPTATSTDNDFTVTGTLISDGGTATTERGTYWKTTSDVTSSDHSAKLTPDPSPTTWPFQQTRSASVNAATKYYYVAYGKNAVGTGVSPVSFIWTLQTAPAASGNMTSATGSSGSTVDLVFPAYGGAANGIVIIRKTGGSGWTSTDLLQGKAPNQQPGYVTTISSSGQNNFTDTGLLGGTQYTYSAIPFSVLAGQDSTTNYKTTFNTKTATTDATLSRVSQNAAPANTLDYASEQGGTIASSSDGLSLADLVLLDGNAPADDPDSKDTDLATLTIHVNNAQYINHIALLDNTTIVDEGTLDASGNITFTIPTGQLVGTDDNNSGDQFNIIANFKSVVSDGAVIQVTITGATVHPGSSGLVDAAAGGYTTGPTKNAIAVVASQFAFSGTTNPINPNAAWGFTATLEDALNNVDTNIGGNVTISEATLSGTLTRPVSSGVVTFTGLIFSDAGNKSVNLDASNWAGASNGTLNVPCESLGINVWGPQNQQFCFNSASGGFSDLNPIGFRETDKADLGAGPGQTFSLQLPSGFIFNTGVLPTITAPVGSEVNSISNIVFVNNTTLRFQYSVSGTTNTTLDSIRIAGLKVKYTDTVTVSNAKIIRIGGTASQVKNADTDGRSHGTLKTADGPIGVTFQNAAGTASQTAFSRTSAAVPLQGQKSSDLSVLAGANAVFSGEGVAFDGTKYNFNPSTVSNGNHDITFTYIDPAAPNCISNVTKTYSVFSSLITGLNSTYCVNDIPADLLNPTTPPPSGCFVATSHNYYWFDWDYTTFGGTWVLLPDQAHFDPGSSVWAEEVAHDGGVYIRANYNDLCFPGNYYELGNSFVVINQLPAVSFSPTFPFGVCATDAPYDMTGAPYTPANGFDQFWSSDWNAPGTARAGITGDRAAGFKFDPQLANSGSTDKQIQINYRHKDNITGCVNTTYSQVNVWAKPAKMLPADIIFNGAPTVAAEFCYKDNLTPFSTAAVTNVIHSWSSVRGNIEGEVFAPVANDFTNTAGIPDIGATASYGVSQIVDRQYGLRLVGFPIFTIEQYVAFNGCSSDPLTLSATIKQPTIVKFNNLPNPTSAKICEGNPLILADLVPSISSPDPAIGGYWRSNSATPGIFRDASGNRDSSYANAVRYFPDATEVTAKLFTLTLTSGEPIGPCNPTSLDATISISPGIVITFPVSPVRACAADAMPVTTKLSSDVGVTWTFDIASHGTIAAADASQLTTIYRPNQAEKDLGHTVTLTVTSADPDGAGPCTTVSNTVDLIISQKPLIDAGIDYSICSDTLQLKKVLLQATKPAGLSSATSISWSNLTPGSTGVFDDNTALSTNYNPLTDTTSINVENPGVVRSPFTKVLTFMVTASSAGLPGNACPSESDVILVTIHGTPKRPAVDNSDIKYCVGDGVALLKTSVIGPSWYDDISGANPTPFSTASSVSPGVLSDHEQQKVPRWLTQTFDGCESYFTPFTITVNPNPVAAFDYAHQCFGEVMQFTNQSTVPDPFGTGRIISSYEWFFDDGLTTGSGAAGVTVPVSKSTSGTFDNPGHKYDDIKKYNVRLNVTSSDGCKGTLVAIPPIEVGPIPVADFTEQRVCDKDFTTFTSSSGLPVGVTATYNWDFGDATASTAQNPVHQFAGVNTYSVTMIAKTALNCADTVTRTVAIFPYVTNFPYIETFESPTHGWFAEGTVTTDGVVEAKTSWNLLTLADTITSDPDPAAGPTFWATHTNVSQNVFYYDNERSTLYGPCVDMTKLPRPVIAMDYIVDTETKGDGVYIEYKDEAANINGPWVRLGDGSSGLNWYNDGSIGGLSSLGGVGQTLGQFGWDGHPSNGWTTGRYNLDPLAGSSRLRFRVVFGSNTSPLKGDVFDGFALDYFKLETRNRLVLVESFTSKSTAKAVTDNRDAFKTFPSVASSSEVVKIEYHTGLPAIPGDTEDPIFTQNPMDPNARASFYGLSAVPRAYIDGATDGPFGTTGAIDKGWAEPYYSTESLRTSPLDIKIDTVFITNGTMNIKGKVLAKEFALLPNSYSIYVAVVEESVGTDAFVLRKMLPSASGRKVPATAKGTTFDFNETWAIDKSYLSPNGVPQLIAVAFVQSDISSGGSQWKEKQVLQAAYKNSPAVNFTTGLELPAVDQVAMYPNPADRVVNIELPEPTKSGVEIHVIDQLGRPVLHGSIGAGQQSTTVDVSSLSSTLYLVQLKENGVSTTRRLLVTHKHGQ